MPSLRHLNTERERERCVGKRERERESRDDVPCRLTISHPMWKKKVDKKANKTINKFDSAYIVLNLVVPHPNFLAAAHSESSTHACRPSKVIPSRSFSSSSSSSLDDASSSSPPPSKLTLFLRVVIVVCRRFVFPFAIAPIAWTGPLFPRHIISFAARAFFDDHRCGYRATTKGSRFVCLVLSSRARALFDEEK